MARIISILLLLMIASTTLAQTEREEPEGQLAQPVLYEIEGMEEVTLYQDIPFSELEDESLYMDIYTRSERDAPFPVVVISSGDLPPAPNADPRKWGQYTGWGRLVAASGMAAVVYSHRPVRQEGYAAGAEDMDAGIAYIIEHAEDYNLDPSRMCFMAVSAQVPTGITPALRETPDYVKCAVAYYGVMEVAGRVNNAYSPLYYLQNAETVPPILIAKAGLDMPRINTMIDRFVGVAAERGLDVTLIEHPNGVHAFDMLTDDETTDQIIQQTLDFLAEHLEAH